MQNAFRKFFSSPVFPEDEDKTRSAAILNIIGWSTMFIVLAILVTRALRAAHPGRVLLATRDNPRAAAAMAVPVVRNRLVG